MPHIDVTMYPGRDDATKAALAAKLRRCVADELKIDSKVVSVSVEDVPREDWKQHLSTYSGSMFIKPGE